MKRKRLIDEGLASEDSDHILYSTDKGRAALVEVFFPNTGRLVRLPLVDVGPRPSINAIADLTVAATCFLQKKTDDEQEVGQYRGESANHRLVSVTSRSHGGRAD